MVLQVRDISLVLRLGEDVRTLLEPTSFSLGPGEVLGLTGPSGAGKTTLLRVVMGLEGRSSGAVVLDGRPVEPGDLPDFRCRVQLVPQRLSLGTGTAGHYLREVRGFRSAAGAPEPGRVAQELEELGLEGAHLERPFSELSGGERRRVCLALALAREPKFLLLDEPTSGLDGRARERLLSRVERAASGGMGILLATHEELVLARLSREVLILYDGVLQGRGPTAELLGAAWHEIRRGGPG